MPAERAPDLTQVPDSASALVENALWAEVLRLEALYNGGEPFPAAPSRLRTGPGQRGIERLSRPRQTAQPPTKPAALPETEGEAP